MTLSIPRPVVNTDAEHSEISPSGSSRWLYCTASTKFIREVVDRSRPKKSNVYAEEGTAAHEFAAYCLENGVEPKSLKGKSFNGFKVENEMIRYIKTYVDYVEGQQSWDDTLFVECTYPMDFLSPGMMGTADAVIVSHDHIEIIDLKYGKGVVVEVKKNTQLQIYGLGVLAHLFKHGLKFDDDFPVKLTIHQPRAKHVDGPRRSWNTTVGALREFQREVISKIKEGEEGGVFDPGEKQCMWCEAGPMCKAWADFNLKLAMLEFEDFTKPKKEFAQDLAEPKTLTPTQMSTILDHAKAIDRWLKSLAEHAEHLLTEGKDFPNYKLVRGRANRAWNNSDAMADALIELGYTKEDLYNTKIKSPAQIENTIEKDDYKIIEPFITKPDGKITIAHITDGRPSVDPLNDVVEDWKDEAESF